MVVMMEKRVVGWKVVAMVASMAFLRVEWLVAATVEKMARIRLVGSMDND